MGVRWAVLYVLAGCYQPTFPSGAACAIASDCPGGQPCVDNVCGGLVNMTDAQPPDASVQVDADPDASVDPPSPIQIVIGDDAAELADTEILEGVTVPHGDGDHTSVDSTQTSLIRFDLSSIGGTITRATLRFLPGANHSSGIEVHRGLSQTWSESGLTFSNAPGFDAAISATSGSLTSGTWASMDVTGAVSGSLLTLVLTTASATQTNVASRESSSGGPVLVVESYP